MPFRLPVPTLKSEALIPSVLGCHSPSAGLHGKTWTTKQMRKLFNGPGGGGSRESSWKFCRKIFLNVLQSGFLISKIRLYYGPRFAGSPSPPWLYLVHISRQDSTDSMHFIPHGCPVGFSVPTEYPHGDSVFVAGFFCEGKVNFHKRLGQQRSNLSTSCQ